LEVNLEDLEHSNGKREAYWVLAIETTREHHRILQQQISVGTTTAATNCIDGHDFINSHLSHLETSSTSAHGNCCGVGSRLV
jgi:hypothetical protein